MHLVLNFHLNMLNIFRIAGQQFFFVVMTNRVVKRHSFTCQRDKIRIIFQKYVILFVYLTSWRVCETLWVRKGSSYLLALVAEGKIVLSININTQKYKIHILVNSWHDFQTFAFKTFNNRTVATYSSVRQRVKSHTVPSKPRLGILLLLFIYLIFLFFF